MDANLHPWDKKSLEADEKSGHRDTKFHEPDQNLSQEDGKFHMDEVMSH